ncbi:MAG: hypothetical protein EBZ47_06880 [Chlamydiae bacterium]|nr:hypothetical protein [Chlamydiota bacterium]
MSDPKKKLDFFNSLYSETYFFKKIIINTNFEIKIFSTKYLCILKIVSTKFVKATYKSLDKDIKPRNKNYSSWEIKPLDWLC